LANIMSHLVGVRVYQEYKWEFCGIPHLAIHGHQFDGFQVNRVRLSSFGTSLYLRMQKLDVKGKPIARWIDRLNTRWLRMSLKGASGACAHADQHGDARIFGAHTHEAVSIERDGINYYNAGGWVDSRLTYLTIDEQGVRIHEYRERADDSDSSQKRGETDSAFADFADDAGLLEDVEYQGVGR